MRETVLEVPCDIVIPAAMEGTLTEATAAKLTARRERQRVLDRLDQTWGLLAAQDPSEWRPAALTAAIGRVVEGMRAGGMIRMGAE